MSFRGYRPARRGQYVPNLPELRRIGARVAAEQGPVYVEPSQPDALGTEQGIYTRLPGANYPPAGARPVDVIGDANLAASAVSALVTITVPDTVRFRIAGIGFGADDDIALGYLTWAILHGSDVAPGYEQQQAAIGSIRQLADIFDLVGSSLTVTVRATISAAAPAAPAFYRYLCRVRGWFYTEQKEERQ
jgi:hypothetical protein